MMLVEHHAAVLSVTGCGFLSLDDLHMWCMQDFMLLLWYIQIVEFWTNAGISFEAYTD
jgi:hypothetical protein